MIDKIQSHIDCMRLQLDEVDRLLRDLRAEKKLSESATIEQMPEDSEGRSIE